jgi:hypothetical protein
VVWWEAAACVFAAPLSGGEQLLAQWAPWHDEMGEAQTGGRQDAVSA